MLHRSKATAGVLAATLFASLVGCTASPTPAPSGSGAPGGSGEPVTITFQHQFNDAQNAAIEALVASFETEHPEIKVELLRDNDSSYYDKLVTQITGGAGPDIARIEPVRSPQYIAAGWALPVDDVITDVDNYIPSALEPVLLDGKLYGIPLDVEGLALIYRTDLLASVGYDKAPATWDELADAATKLTKDGNYGVGLFGGWGAFEFYPWLWQAGAEMLNADGTEATFNSPEAVAALQYWVELQKTVMPPGMATATEDDLKGPFVSGSLAMLTSGPWIIPSMTEAGIDGKWAIAPLPTGKQAATVLGGMDLLVLKNSKHPEQAKAFLSWLMQDDNVKQYYTAIGGLPVKSTLYTDPAFAEDPNVVAFKEVLEQAKSRPTVAASGDIDAALGEAVQAALAGTATPQEALDAAVAKANEALQQ
ncbi:MAG: sugar ABC transporter substrate-binding protein [Propionicimonas sp.]